MLHARKKIEVKFTFSQIANIFYSKLIWKYTLKWFSFRILYKKVNVIMVNFTAKKSWQCECSKFCCNVLTVFFTEYAHLLHLIFCFACSVTEKLRFPLTEILDVFLPVCAPIMHAKDKLITLKFNIYICELYKLTWIFLSYHKFISIVLHNHFANSNDNKILSFSGKNPHFQNLSKLKILDTELLLSPNVFYRIIASLLKIKVLQKLFYQMGQTAIFKNKVKLRILI